VVSSLDDHLPKPYPGINHGLQSIWVIYYIYLGEWGSHHPGSGMLRRYRYTGCIVPPLLPLLTIPIM